MRIYLKTKVAQDMQAVFAQFDEHLFLKLNPPGLPVQLVRFDGCEVEDEVHLKFPFGMQWVSVITKAGQTDKMCYFVDEGRRLPFPLKKWTHQHLVVKETKGTAIVDDIFFQTQYKLLDVFIYPFLWLQFAYRKP